MNKNYQKYTIFMVVLVCIATACDPNRVIDENRPIENKLWNSNTPVSFSTEVTDTSSRYNLYVNVRHGDDYPFINLWVNIHTIFPHGDTVSTRVELPLASNKKGWYGKCMGDICDIQVPIQLNAVFTVPGKYMWILQQNMRKDPLPSIREIGFRLEKVPSP